MALSLDFAFEGFRVLRARPKLIAFWGVITLLGNGLAAVVQVALAGPALQRLQTLVAQPDLMDAQAQLQAAMTALLQQLAPAWLASQAISLVTGAILAAAVLRAISGEGDDRLGFLQFGARELQLLAVRAANLALTLGLPAACLAGSLNPGFEMLSLPGLMALGAAPWLWVRLSLNSAQSFAEKRIAIFDSFQLTRGVFWPLLGGYLLALLLAGVVLYLGGQVAEGIVTVIFGDVAAVLAKPDMSSVQAFLTPERALAVGLVYALVSPQLMAILLAAPAEAYRRLSAGQARKPASTPVS